jgi:hypothetical protein
MAITFAASDNQINHNDRTGNGLIEQNTIYENGGTKHVRILIAR